jgi:HemY protein
MRSALLYLVLLAAAVAGVLWLVRLDGMVEMRVGDAEIAITLPMALVLAAVLFLLGHLLLVSIAAMRRWPARLRARSAAKRHAQGEAAVTRTLIALAAGAPDLARLEAGRARIGLGDTPQTLMLVAEAERLAGREDAASDAFEKLAQLPDANFLGLRGLLRQAIQRQDWPTAQRLAREAEAAQPGAAWLRQERETLAIRTRDWREALALSPPGAAQAGLALAAAGQEEDERKATDLERQAFRADPGFAPAALAVAARHKLQGSPRRAKATLEEGWAKQPHPDLAVAYLEGIAEPLPRMKAAETLVQGKPRHPESHMLVARAALEAGLTGRARQELDALVATGQADRRAYLALADLEEQEKGDTPEGRSAQARWLRSAATAAPEARWRCSHCGTEHEAWAPICGSCQSVGTIGWTSPQQLPATVG